MPDNNDVNKASISGVAKQNPHRDHNLMVEKEIKNEINVNVRERLTTSTANLKAHATLALVLTTITM